MARREQLSLRDLYYRVAAARGHLLLIGDSRQIADVLEEWFLSGAADGFNVMPAWLPGSLKDFVDLVDFCEELQSRSHSEQVKTCAKSAAAAAAEAIVEARAEGTGVERAHGLSIYFPSAAPDTTLDYARLDFARKTRWDEFLAKFKNS